MFSERITMSAIVLIGIFSLFVTGLSRAMEAPSFLTEPPSLLEFTNQTGISVGCVARGDPPPQVTWISVDGLPLTDVQDLRRVVYNGTLIYLPFAATAYRPDIHSGTYRCSASNSAGTILSRDMKLRAVLGQAYDVQAVGGSSIKGGLAVLRCVVPVSIRNDVQVTSWVQDFTGFTIFPTLQGDGKYHMLPSGELYIYRVDKSDQFNHFRCRTQHRFSSMSQISSNAVSITVTDPLSVIAPTMFNKVGTIHVEAEKNVAIPCVTQGFPVPELRWFRIDSNGPTSLEDFTVSFGVLALENVQSEDSGTYRCTASNSVGQSQYDIRLEVVEPLRAEISGGDVVVNQGKSTTLRCWFSSWTQATVKWYKDGVAISHRDKYQPIGKDSLRINSMQRTDQGIYQCFVSTERASAQAFVHLILGDAAPQILHTFNEQTLVPGPFVTLKCAAIGNPTPDITWTLDRYPMPVTDRIAQNHISSVTGEIISYLNISSAHVEDGGEYTCSARNTAGDATHSARLNIYGLPYIRPIPKITAVAEADVLIRCPAAGYPILEIVWMKGEEVLRDGNKYTLDHQGGLTIHSVSRSSDAGVYTCTARDRQGHTAKRDATLDVVVAPKITPFQVDPTLRLGERLTLTCAVSKGDPPLTIGWMVNGHVVTSAGGEIKTMQINAFTSILAIDSLHMSHSGNYTCLVRNAAGQVSQSQLVVIQVLPKIEPFAFPDDLRQGIRTRLLCGVSQGDLPLEIVWHKDDRTLVQHATASVKELDTFTSVLTFTNLSAADAGLYECIVRNAAGLTRYGSQLYVQVPPYWTIEPKDVKVLLGHALSVHCRADGYPTPNVTWSRASGPNFQESVLLTNQTPGIKVYDNGTLHIRSARKTIQGRYICRALSKVGQDLAATISITVNAGPRFRETLSRVSVKRDSAATLECRVEGDSPLDLAWRRSSSSPALLTTNYRLRIQDKEMQNGAVSTLTLPNAQVEDTGVYICIASNAHGQLERDFQLTVQEPPEQPRHLQIQETFSRRISLSWLPPVTNSLNPVTAYIIQYKESSHGMWQETDNLSGYSTSYTVEGLQPSTSYHFKVLAETSAGRGPSSEVVNAMTHGEPPGTAPNDFRAVAVSSTSIRLTWSGIVKGMWHSHLIGYHVGFREPNSMSYNFTTIPLTDHHTNMEFVLTNLRKYSKYTAVVRGFNRYGEGPLSQPVTTSTFEDVPSASPSSVRCSSTSSHSIDVTWQAPPSSELNGVIQTYRIHYEPALAQFDLTGLQSKTVDGLFITLAGLLSFTTYRIRVEALTRIGGGPLSPIVACRTDEAVPGPPADVKAHSTGPNTITLCWSPPLQPNGEILHYSLSVKPGGSHAVSNIIRHTVTGKQTFYEIENLSGQPDFYEIWLTAANRAGPGDKSKVLRYSLTYKAAGAICSFGRRISQPWKTNVLLPCQTVGGTSTSRNWMFNSKALTKSRIEESARIDAREALPSYHFENGSQLVVQELKPSDSGNYSCSIKNGFSIDSITYHLVVLGPPSPPVMHVSQTSQNMIQIHWKMEEGNSAGGASSVRGFLLHWRKEGGDWEERELDRLSTSTQLDNLQCGTRYQLYLTSHNLIGTSGPSNMVTARTKGDVPLVLSLTSGALSVYSTHVAVHLKGWQERGCPILSFALDYKMDGETLWMSISDDIQNLPTVFIEDLQPSTAYNIRAKARTSSGNVVAEYDLVTLDHSGAAPPADRVNRAGRLLPSADNSSHVILPWWLIAAVSTIGTASLLGLGVACYCLYKTRTESLRLTSTLPSDSTLVDGNTWGKGGQKSSGDRSCKGSRRGSTYELHTMDKMSSYSDNHDDIYPYATFELHREHTRSFSGDGGPSPIKLREGPPDFTRLKFARDVTKSTLPVRPSPWSELSTIEIERHFQGSPTVSESDLELAIPPRAESVMSGQDAFRSTNGRSQRKEYGSKLTLKRLAGGIKDDYSSTDSSPSTEQNFQKHRHRPSHPLPKKLPLLRLVDQSNLWSGDQDGPWRPCTSEFTGNFSTGSLAKPKVRGGKHVDSPTDHSIAV